MEKKKLIYFLLMILFFAVLILGIVISFSKKTKDLRVNFLNVGQGDAILIQSGDNQVLIDSGKNGKLILEKLGEQLPFWDRKIELVIITHPDFDHYGGFTEVLKKYQVEGVIKTEAENDTAEWIDFKDKLEKENSKLISATRGTKINFSNGAVLEIIYPLGAVSPDIEDKNDSSVVSRLVFGENEFLFTGDLSLEGEQELVASGMDISADVLKVGHHGSRSSTGDKFLDSVRPKEAVISVGKNSYGHPHREVIERLNQKDITIWQTDKSGNIEYRCLTIEKNCEVRK